MSPSSLPEIPEENIYFLSPHADDIVLTFGGLIEAKKGFSDHKIHCMVFFGTSNWTENALNVKTEHRVETVTQMRFAEDRLAMSQMFGGWRSYQYTFQPFFDSLLRDYAGPVTAGGGPGGNFETFRALETEHFLEIVELLKIIVAKKNTAIFTLAAIGSHIDHFILREALIKAAHDLGDKAQAQIYFGEDQPYTGAPENQKRVTADIDQLVKRLGLQPLTYPINVQDKIALFENTYYSQYSIDYSRGLFARSEALQGGERIYLWPKANYARAPTDESCKQAFCKLTG